MKRQQLREVLVADCLFTPRGHAACGHIPPGTGKSLSTEKAHSIFADVCFPEQAQGQVLSG